MSQQYDTSQFLVSSSLITEGDSATQSHFEAMMVKLVKSEKRIVHPSSNKEEIHTEIQPSNQVQQIALYDDDIANSIVLPFQKGAITKINTNQFEMQLNKLANELRLTKGVVLVTGYSDSEGDNDVNLGLALERANLIKQMLIRKGIDDHNIIIESMGEAHPVADNNTEAGRNRNRRVVIQKM